VRCLKQLAADGRFIVAFKGLRGGLNKSFPLPDWHGAACSRTGTCHPLGLYLQGDSVDGINPGREKN